MEMYLPLPIFNEIKLCVCVLLVKFYCVFIFPLPNLCPFIWAVFQCVRFFWFHSFMECKSAVRLGLAIVLSQFQFKFECQFGCSFLFFLFWLEGGRIRLYQKYFRVFRCFRIHFSTVTFDEYKVSNDDAFLPFNKRTQMEMSVHLDEISDTKWPLINSTEWPSIEIKWET